MRPGRFAREARNLLAVPGGRCVRRGVAGGAGRGEGPRCARRDLAGGGAGSAGADRGPAGRNAALRLARPDRARSRIPRPLAAGGAGPGAGHRAGEGAPQPPVRSLHRRSNGTSARRTECLIAAAGTRIDPLARMTLARDLLFVDGRREAEIAWALAREIETGRPIEDRPARRPAARPDAATPPAPSSSTPAGAWPRGSASRRRRASSSRPKPGSASPNSRSRTGMPPDRCPGQAPTPNKRIEPMLNINRATLLGHAGRDPEIRELKNGGKAAVFTLATTEKWKDREGAAAETGAVRENTEWHRIVVYGPGRRGGRENAAQGRRGAGRGQDRHARISRQGRQRPRRHRNRRRRMAGHGQHPVRAARRARIPVRGRLPERGMPRQAMARRRTPDR